MPYGNHKIIIFPNIMWQSQYIPYSPFSLACIQIMTLCFLLLQISNTSYSSFLDLAYQFMKKIEKKKITSALSRVLILTRTQISVPRAFSLFPSQGHCSSNSPCLHDFPPLMRFPYSIKHTFDSSFLINCFPHQPQVSAQLKPNSSKHFSILWSLISLSPPSLKLTAFGFWCVLHL